MLRIENVSKVYPGADEQVRALDDITLKIDSGEFTAVQGPSGCGKTTLLLTIGGLLRPDSGSVRVDGEEFYSLPVERRAAFRASTIGFVFQQFHLVPYLSVVENVLSPTLALPAANARARAMELLDRFNISNRANHTPGRLSTGERQRVALARAMFQDPAVVLADEPTGNLDEDNAAIVLESLADFAQAGGTVLLVTHDRAAASQAAKVLYLREGQLVDENQPESTASAHPGQ